MPNLYIFIHLVLVCQLMSITCDMTYIRFECFVHQKSIKLRSVNIDECDMSDARICKELRTQCLTLSAIHIIQDAL